ncbi:MAG: hypothetical protein AMJ90_05900 [candidate division Zixibacteria bacterium SM23_73_2]|nr:MAG: hypothetical protein AMJ90_05900 [candidate division Zixibacteria bacterium SM23_73_2]
MRSFAFLKNFYYLILKTQPFYFIHLKGLLPKSTNVTLYEVKDLLFLRKLEECFANEILLPAFGGGSE